MKHNVVDREVKDLAIQNDPRNVSAIEKEYSENMEQFDLRQKRGQDLMKVIRSFADYMQRQEDLREQIRREEIRKIKKETEQLIDIQWKSREEEMRHEISEQLECQKSHLQEKEHE